MRFVEKFKNNIGTIIATWVTISTSIFTILSFVLLFFQWDEFGFEQFSRRIWLFILIVVGSFFASTIYIVYIKKIKKIWSRGKNKFCAMYGDIFKIGFKNKKESIE